MRLYRYIPLEKFEEMLNTSKLRFVNPLTAWEDKKEGPLYRKVKTSEGQKKIVQVMRDNGFAERDIQQWTNVLNKEIYGLRCQCWTKSPDCNKMWEEYAQNMQGVRIETSVEKMRSLQYMGHTIELLQVIYKTWSLEDEIKSVFDKRNQVFYFPRAFQTKEMKYEFENEMRAYTITDRANAHNDYIMVPIPEMVNFIISVKVHPQAKKEVLDNVRTLCEKYGLQFLQ